DVLLVPGKFRIVEDLDDNGKSYPILKSSLLLNMMPVTKEAPVISENCVTVTLTIETKDFIDQDNMNQEFECHHLVSA
ncbi:12956_t:CDS:2, partial [Racocetra persica]